MKLKELGEYFIGLTYKPEAVADNGTIVLRSGNIQDGKFDLSDIIRVNTKIRDKQYVKPGDILMCSRNGSVRLVGKSTIIPELSEPMTFGAFMTVFRTPYNSYLQYFFQSNSFRKQLSSSKTTTINQITISMLDNIDIDLPEKTILEERCNKLGIIASIIDARKKELGRLDELIKARFVEIFGDPVSNSKCFTKEELGKVCTKITDGTHDTPERYPEGYLLITGKNIRASGIIFDDVEYVSEEDHNVIYARCNPEYEDVLYTNIGVNYGTACLNDLQYEFSMKNVALLKPDRNRINGYYLWICLNLMRDHILLMNQVGGAQTFMGLATIKKIIIPIPPIELQNGFIDDIKQVDKSKVVVQKALDETQLLFDSLMQQYFG